MRRILLRLIVALVLVAPASAGVVIYIEPSATAPAFDSVTTSNNVEVNVATIDWPPTLAATDVLVMQLSIDSGLGIDCSGSGWTEQSDIANGDQHGTFTLIGRRDRDVYRAAGEVGDDSARTLIEGVRGRHGDLALAARKRSRFRRYATPGGTRTEARWSASARSATGS